MGKIVKINMESPRQEVRSVDVSGAARGWVLFPKGFYSYESSVHRLSLSFFMLRGDVTLSPIALLCPAPPLLLLKYAQRTAPQRDRSLCVQLIPNRQFDTFTWSLSLWLGSFRR